jgi:hypothetical protein
VLLFLIAMGLPLLTNLCLLGIFQGCRACHGLMRRGATKCPHCRTPYRKSVKAAA